MQARKTRDAAYFDHLREYKKHTESQSKQEQAKREDYELRKERFDMAERVARLHAVFEQSKEEPVCACLIM